MKYWYLKDGEALGPMTPAQIMADADFSMGGALVCPQDKSGDEDAWKAPAEYLADFTPKAPEPPKPLPEIPQPADPLEATIHTVSPVNAPLEDNLLAELPAQAPLAGKEQSPADSFFASMEDYESPSQGTPVAKPAHRRGAASPRGGQMGGIFDKKTINHARRAALVTSLPPAMPSNHSRIINTIDPLGYDTRPQQKKDTLFLLMAAMLVVLAAVMVVMLFMDSRPRRPVEQEPQQAAPAQTEAAPSARAPIAALQALEEGVPAPVAPPMVPGDRQSKMAAQRLVRDYLLDAQRGTIDEFFTKEYAGYNTFWTADHLHENTYVVEFSASKVRKEPIKYLFRIDTAKRQLLGMNDITINLLSL